MGLITIVDRLYVDNGDKVNSFHCSREEGLKAQKKESLEIPNLRNEVNTQTGKKKYTKTQDNANPFKARKYIQGRSVEDSTGRKQQMKTEKRNPKSIKTSTLP